MMAPWRAIAASPGELPVDRGITIMRAHGFLTALALAGAIVLTGCGDANATPEETVRYTNADVQEALATDELPTITVYHTPTCGCCGAWVDHVEAEGFPVEVHITNTGLQPVREEHGLPSLLGSCHTAVVEGYLVEGHVPASDIRKLLVERPEIDGIAVPGMPMGSPGMEGPYKESYSTIAYTRDGGMEVFASH
jgi:hypothetical protein